MSSVLDFLLEVEEEVGRKQHEEQVQKIEEQRALEEAEVENKSWLNNDSKNNDAKEKKDTKPVCWETKFKKVEVSRLVWAPTPTEKNIKFLKFEGGVNPNFPARIADNSEGACAPLPSDKWPIPADHVLVE